MPDKSETITHIELDKLVPFKDHPFAVREDAYSYFSRIVETSACL